MVALLQVFVFTQHPRSGQCAHGGAAALSSPQPQACRPGGWPLSSFGSRGCFFPVLSWTGPGWPTSPRAQLDGRSSRDQHSWRSWHWSDRRWTAGHRRGPGWLGLGPWLPGCVAWRDCPDGTSTRSCWRDHCPPSPWDLWRHVLPLEPSYWSRSSALCLLSRPLCRGCLRGWRTLCWPRWVVRVNLLCCHRTARSPWMMPEICVLSHAQFFGQRADWASEAGTWDVFCGMHVIWWPASNGLQKKHASVLATCVPQIFHFFTTQIPSSRWSPLLLGEFVFWRDASFACCPLAES